MPEPDIADMKEFLEHIELMLPVLGFSFLKPKPVPTMSTGPTTGPSVASPIFQCSSREAVATAREIDGDFIVLKGSTAVKEPRANWTSYRTLRDQLYQEGKLVDDSNPALLRFVEDVSFSSPSAGTAVVNTGNMNGRIAWKTSDTRQTYQDWHESRLRPEAQSDVE